MALESASFINDLDTTNPPSTDKRKQGDDHLRLIKTAMKGSFPTSTKAWYNPNAASKSANYTVLATDMNKLILLTTTGGAITMTLPSLVSGDAGWECSFIKVTTDTNPYFVAPPSGTIQSGEYTGLAKTRRCIPGRRTRVFWTGTAWIAERVNTEPLGAVIPMTIIGTTLPVGYEWPNGQTLASASTNYPDFYAANGSSGVVLDLRGRVDAGRDDMGGSAASRLTSSGLGVAGTTVGNAGGAQTVTLTTNELPAHTHTFSATTSTNGAHTHTYTGNGTTILNSGGGFAAVDTTRTTSSNGDHTHTVSGTTASSGSGNAFSNVQPTIVLNKILVVE